MFKLKKPSIFELIIFNFAIKTRNFFSINFFLKFLFNSNKIQNFLVSVHDYNDSLDIVSSNTGIKLYVLQDSFLPDNYTSKYLKFLHAANKFLIWDKLSNNFFQNNGLKFEKSNILANKILI